MGQNSLKTTASYLASFEKEERQKNAAPLTRFVEKPAGHASHHGLIGFGPEAIPLL